MKQKIELVKGTAFELDPAKKYLIIFDSTQISMADAHSLNKALDGMGIKGVTALIRDPGEVKVVESE